MTILPIVERELRVAARRKGTYRVRFIAALAALLIFAWGYLISTVQASSPGRELFCALATLAFAYTLLSGTRITADCLSEEKREGTLGLLFLTDLKGYDVVLGKLAATSMNAFYGLLAIFPVLAIPLLMGGVAPGLFWRMVLVLLNTLFFSLAAGVFISALCRHERKAMGGTFLWILLFTGGVPLLGLLLGAYVFKTRTNDFVQPFFWTSPAFAFGSTLTSAFGAAPGRDFGWSVLIVHLLGWNFLALACAIVPRSWREGPASARWTRWRERWQRWSFGDSAERKALRTKLLEINPFYWLAGRDRLQQSLVWGFLGLSGAGFFLGYIKYPAEWLSTSTAIATAIILHLALKLWIASESCRRFIEDRREGALELLLSTPLSVPEILLGLRLAMRRQFGGPLVAVLIADFLLFWIGWRDWTEVEERRQLLVVFAVGMTMLVADYYTLIWVGMWLGLSARKTHQATGGILARVLILPWVLFLLSLSLLGILEAFWGLSRNWNIEPNALHLMLWWFALGIATDLFFGWRSYHKLHRQFREVVMRRYLPVSPRRFGWLFRAREA